MKRWPALNSRMSQNSRLVHRARCDRMPLFAIDAVAIRNEMENSPVPTLLMSPVQTGGGRHIEPAPSPGASKPPSDALDPSVESVESVVSGESGGPSSISAVAR